MIEMGIDGFSTTVFCYGQTGSGKTHTLTGPPYLVCSLIQKSLIFMQKIWYDINEIQEKILTNDHGKNGKEQVNY